VFPFKQQKIDKNLLIREFHPKDSDDFVWHKDKEDRIICLIEGESWFIQFDNCFPILLIPNDKITINKNVWHRIICCEESTIAKIKIFI